MVILEDRRGAMICEYASRRLTLSAPSAWSVVAASFAGLALWVVVWWETVSLMARWGFAERTTGGVAWGTGIAAFVLAQWILPRFFHATRWHFDPAAREVMRSTVIFGIPTRARRVCGFAEVGKLSICRLGGEGGMAVELWVGDRVERLPASRRLVQAVPQVATMVGKKKQGWDRYGSWT